MQLEIVAATIDGLGNVTSNVWSVTQHLLKTHAAPSSTGRTVRITNIYDNRDLLECRRLTL